MSGVRTLDDFIRHRMTVERSKRVTIVRRPDGLFEASWVHADGKTTTVEVDADPTTALWNSLAPFQMRRRLPSGRDVVADGDTLGLDHRVARKPVHGPVEDDIDSLLGITPTATVVEDDDLEGLLG